MKAMKKMRTDLRFVCTAIGLVLSLSACEAFPPLELETPTATITSSPPTSTPPPSTSTPFPPTRVAEPTPTDLSEDDGETSAAATALRPPLIEVVLAEDDIFSTDSSYEIALFTDRFQTWRDATHELSSGCRLDCAKIVIEAAPRTLTITLSLEDSAGTANQSAMRLQADYFKEGNAREHPDARLKNATSDSWVLYFSEEQIITVGTAYGQVVMLVVLEFDLCSQQIIDGETVRYCEGDGFIEALAAVTIGDLQLAKLASAGYAP